MAIEIGLGAFGIITFFIVRKIVDMVNVKESKSYKITVNLRWDQVCQFYWLNPNRWKYKRVLLKGYSTIETHTKVLLYESDECVIRVRLSPIDNLFFFFARHLNKNRNNIEIEKLLNSVQSDIDKVRELSNAQVKQATEKMKQIEERIYLQLK